MTSKEFEDWLLAEQQKALKDYFPFDYKLNKDPLDQEGQRFMIQAWTDCLRIFHSINDTSCIPGILSNALGAWRDHYDGSDAYFKLLRYYEPIVRYVQLRIDTDVIDDDRKEVTINDQD